MKNLDNSKSNLTVYEENMQWSSEVLLLLGMQNVADSRIQEMSQMELMPTPNLTGLTDPS